MDFDLFATDDLGDEFVSSVNWEPTQAPLTSERINQVPIFAELHCQGEDMLNSKFAEKSFLRKGFMIDISLEEIFSDCSWQETTSVSDIYSFQAKDLQVTSVLDYSLTEACINIQCLFANVKKTQMTFGHNTATASTTISFFQRRHQVTTLWQVFIYNIDLNLWPIKFAPRLDQVRKQWQSLSRCNNQQWQLIYIANSPKGNESQLAAYHLLHGLLEWKFLDLYLQCKLTKLQITSHIIENTDEFKWKHLTEQFQCFCDDLIICSLLLFTKKRSSLELLNSSCFPCTCFKEIWVLLMKLLKKIQIPLFGDTHGKIEAHDSLNLWILFNNSINKLKGQLLQYSLTNTNYCLFVNWILVALVRLYGYRSNGDFEGALYANRKSIMIENLNFFEKNTQEFLQSQPSEEQLRVYLSLLKPLVVEEWWPTKINLPIQLWEYFHKRLNNVFYVAGSALSQLAVTSTTGQGYLERYRQLQSKSTWDTNLTSYTMFVLLIGNCLRKLHSDTTQLHQIQKLLGRIYSKFSAQKLLSLNETGIHHLIELFLILALNGNLNELMPKLRDQLLHISLDKINNSKQLAVTRGHMAFWLLCAEKRYDLSNYIERFLNQVKAITNNSNQDGENGPVKLLADCLFDIIKEADDFQRGEELLIDTWLPKYLNTCRNSNEIERALEAFHLIFIKLRNNNTNFILDNTSKSSSSLSTFWQSCNPVLKSLQIHLLPFVKQQFCQSYSHWLPKLAADFCLCIDNISNFQQLFNYFIDIHHTKNYLAHTQFLWRILQSDHHYRLIESNVIIQIWLKSLIFQNQNLNIQQQQQFVDEDIKNLNRFVNQLSEFREITGTDKMEISITNDDTDVLNCPIVQSKEPLCSFVAAVGQTYSSISITDIDKRTQFSFRFNSYLKNFDKWLPPVSHNSDYWKSIERPEVINRFYSFMAIVVYHCAPLVYSPAKVTCFLNIVLTRYILPTTIQMGKMPDLKLSQCIHKIWPVLVQGIGRLNYRSDTYVNKALTDIIQKWTPHLKISNNPKIVAKPFIKYLISIGNNDKELRLFILEKLTSLFLVIQRRQPEPHAGLVIAIFQELLDTLSQEIALSKVEEIYLTFIQATTVLMLEHIMLVDELVPSRQQLLELIRRLLTNEHYKQSSLLKSSFVEQLEILTRKHLAYYTFFYFELINKLAQISPQTVSLMMDTLLCEILVVEEKRAAGQDAKIRAFYQKLQQQLTVKTNDKEVANKSLFSN